MGKYGRLIGIIMVCCIIGTVIGIQLNTMVDSDFTSSYKNEIEARELIELKKTNKDMKIKIDDFKNQVEELEKERSEESVPLKKLKLTVDKYKFLSGYSLVSGPGITIVLESNIEANIAEIMEGKKYLINLINELKVFGAEVLSINNYRIVGRTEIILAGNHINVNGISIAQPYVIQAIGDRSSFEQYIEHGTILFELMELDGITSGIKFSDNIEIPPLTKEKPTEHIKVSEE
ncbi:MAG TPA: DUF881 domain-containing protein, partial [Oscillospiraceae bacterium]|nr:DUF881 domain-containing protein [Oscillospiraceae bacterium]